MTYITGRFALLGPTNNPMIKFFGKIRFDLMENNKTGKPAWPVGRYLKYAIGEIILVMIGILLALQVNNWNQNRIELKEEKEVIAKLHRDFKENKKTLNDYINTLNDEMSALTALINLVGASKEELAKHNLDSIFFVSLGANEVAFADNTLKNIVQSGRLNLLKNETVTNLLYRWNTLSDIRSTRFKKLDDWSNDEFTPYLLTKISFKEMDANGDLNWTGPSKVKPDYHPLFQEVVFENQLDNILWLHHQVLERCNESMELINDIIETTKE